jgi:hemerythrin-like domain-containing protein
MKSMSTVNEPMADVRDMFAVHTAFRREFGLMADLVRAVPDADTQRGTVVADHVLLMTNLLTQHHTGEDKYIWPLLRERSPDDDYVWLVDTMEEQHKVIHVCLHGIQDAASEWRASASAETREALVGEIDQFVSVIAEHLALEEERVVPLIERHLSDAEYSLAAQDAGVHIPPDKLPLMFGMVMYEGDPEVIDAIVAHMPPEVQPVIKDIGSQAYAAYAAELYGSSTPRRNVRL